MPSAPQWDPSRDEAALGNSSCSTPDAATLPGRPSRHRDADAGEDDRVGLRHDHERSNSDIERKRLPTARCRARPELGAVPDVNVRPAYKLDGANAMLEKLPVRLPPPLAVNSSKTVFGRRGSSGFTLRTWTEVDDQLRPVTGHLAHQSRRGKLGELLVKLRRRGRHTRVDVHYGPYRVQTHPVGAHGDAGPRTRAMHGKPSIGDPVSLPFAPQCGR